MIAFRKARFVVSAPDVASRPKDGLPSILMVGRSNVGKSTLINALLGQKLAFSSKKAGKTKLLNYFLVDESFYLVDAPGYGSTSYATLTTIGFAKMMEDYVKEPSLRAMMLLLDLRREPGKDDLEFLKYLKGTGKPILLVLTKVDQMNQSAKSKALKLADSLGVDEIYLSDLTSKSVAAIRSGIAKLLA